MGAMTAADFIQLGREFQITLPVRYLEFMQHYPAELHTTKRWVGDQGEAVSELHFLDSLESLQELNRRVRTEGVEWSSKGEPWPAGFLAIGEDGCGNCFALNTSSGRDTVYFLDHAEGVLDPYAENLQEFAALLIEEFRNDNQGAEMPDEPDV